MAEGGHPEGGGPRCDLRADAPGADDPQSFAGQFDPLKLFFEPFAPLEPGIALRYPAGQGQHQCHGVFGHRDGCAGRGVDDFDTVGFCGLEVDIVNANPGAPDDFQTDPRGQNLRSYFGPAPDNNRVVTGKYLQQFGGGDSGPVVHMGLGFYGLKTAGLDFVCN